MASYLCLSVLFHARAFHGRRDGGEPEWPPSPLRMFQSLVAASAARFGSDVTANAASPALRWLEAQTPIIITPEAASGAPYRLSVPNNAMDIVARAWCRGNYSNRGDASPATHRAMKTVRPTWLNGGDTVSYLYPLPDTSASDILEYTRMLAVLARSITHVGWGIDMVAASARVLSSEELSMLSGRRWRPMAASSAHLRAPQVGMLDELSRRHATFLSRASPDHFSPVPPLSGYRLIAYDDADRINRRPFAAFDLVPADIDDRRPRTSFRQENIVRVAGMLRHTAWDAAQRDSHSFPGGAEAFVAGHGPHDAAESFPRFSYLPLPTIPLPGQPHADGMIRRAIIAETAGSDGLSAQWARRRLAGLALRDEDRKADVALLAPARLSSDRIISAYLGPSDRWQTVTPMVLPGFDDNDRDKRLKLLLKCFDQAGIPRYCIADLDIQRSPWLAASCQPRAYWRSERLKNLPPCHVRVYFKRAISGPLALGAGRHRGLGLLAVMD